MTARDAAGAETEALWTSAEAAAATGARVFGRWTATGVSIDTRTLEPGDLFVALTDNRDGHEFVPAARAAGAAAALVSKDVDEGPSLIVPDTLEALRGLAVAARTRSAAVRVAVTGSVGKTSVKEALAQVFRRAGRAHASEKSYNNHWGAPLSLARMPRQTERAVFELGMNHAGEIAALSPIIHPDIAVITKIAPAHLEGLGSMEAIADAKGEIFQGLVEGGAAVIPGDDDFAARLAEHAGAGGAGWLVRFGTGAQDEARLAAFETDVEGGRGTAEIFGNRLKFTVKGAGAHWGMNACAVLAAAYLSNVPLELAVEALADAGVPAGRGERSTIRLKDGAFTLIDDSYNANPASMKAAIEALGAAAPGAGGRRIAALGEMRELGPTSPALHKSLAPVLEAARIDLAVLVGEGIRPLAEALPADRLSLWAPNAEEAATHLTKLVRPGDVVMVKGSNAARMMDVAASLKKLETPQISAS